MKALLLALLCALPACGLIAGTYDEKQVEVWWGKSWDADTCAKWGCAYPCQRWMNSDTVIISPTPEVCGCTLVEAICEGLLERGCVSTELWVMDIDLLVPTQEAVALLNEEYEGCFPEPVMHW